MLTDIILDEAVPWNGYYSPFISMGGFMGRVLIILVLFSLLWQLQRVKWVSFYGQDWNSTLENLSSMINLWLIYYDPLNAQLFSS